MNRLNVFSSKHKTWCYRQGFYQYNKIKPKNHYSPLICKLIDVPVVDEALAKKYGAKWDKDEKKWIILLKSECL
tara:strand:+ start:1131 stop:1352 length:222 start_codon:yes stop_codon:yes gene_type:complete